MSTWSRTNRLTAAAVAAVVVTWAVTIAVGLDHLTPIRLFDAETYYLIGSAYVQGVDPYVAFGDRYRQWPLVAALCSPLTWLPQALALRLWTLVSTCCVIATVLAIWRHLLREGVNPSCAWLSLVAVNPAVLNVLETGQMSGLCFAAYGWGLTQVNRHPLRAGVLFTVVAAKPHLAVLVIPILLASAPSASLAFGIGIVVWIVGSLVAAGPQQLMEFFSQLLLVRSIASGETGMLLVSLPISNVVPLASNVRTIAQYLAAALLIVLLLVIAFVRAFRAKQLTNPGIDLVTALVLLLLPYAMFYDALFTTSAMLRLGSPSGTAERIILGASWVLPIIAIFFALDGLSGISALVPLGLVAVLLKRGSLWTPVTRIGRRDLEHNSKTARTSLGKAARSGA